MRIVPMQCGYRRGGVQCSKDAGHRDHHVLDEEFVLTEEGLVPTGRTGRELAADTEPSPPLPDMSDDRRETHARVQTVISLLERCSEELARLEGIPTADADDVNALSGGRGFVARARNMLKGRFA